MIPLDTVATISVLVNESEDTAPVFQNQSSLTYTAVGNIGNKKKQIITVSINLFLFLPCVMYSFLEDK